MTYWKIDVVKTGNLSDVRVDISECFGKGAGVPDKPWDSALGMGTDQKFLDRLCSRFIGGQKDAFKVFITYEKSDRVQVFIKRFASRLSQKGYRVTHTGK